MNRKVLYSLCLLVLLLMGLTGSSAQRIRHVVVRGDEIVTVRTALDVATIIQLPDHPNSVVVGDQDAFKIEYLDQGVTIKPTRPGARSNLYLYTDWKRYDVQLEIGSEATADYVVYLDDPGDSSSWIEGPGRHGTTLKSFVTGVKWTQVRHYMVNEGLRFELSRVGRVDPSDASGVLLAEFTISAKRPTLVKPAWLWLKQQHGRNDETRPIQGLFMSSEEAKPGTPIHGTLQILCKDIDPSIPMRLELIRKHVSVLMIPKVSSWK